ncbi:LytS/YhcK type 5TM receptor domain-containing protein [Desulfosporosinus hippei]|uniref:histidine kinase n=1 Tax=Desulfosporosinus hippei DSM 8344 TaxID=1121419 RepID=A0A1G7ZCK8_9FIRM|nr:LytS/YhcK type 5TM receptor domain-containing protein [Desulfosporosinus hippei]SDH06266.1 two-component system, LytT family, sensor histidine kinase LytS [Desulfosporosinus hippei DSM 8344]
MDLIKILAERLSIIVTIALLMTKSQVFRRYLNSQLNKRQTLTLMLIFGVFSMAGTYSGVSINGANAANTSAIGTVSAGMLGGPLVGLVVGAITGLHFYIFYGGFTGLACAISPILQGLLGGLIYWLARDKNDDWKVGVGLGIIAQIMEMAIILMIARPFEEAWSLIMVIAMPMVIFNGLGVGLFLYIIKTVYHEEEQIAALQAQNVLQIADITLPYFRKGLNLESAQKAAEIIQKISNVAAVAITNKQQIIAYVGLGSDHHFIGQPFMTEAGHKVLRDGKSMQISEMEIECKYPNCPLRSAIAVPLRPGEKTIGALILYRARRGKSIIDVTLAEGLGKLFSTQLELADLEHQKELSVASEIRALQAQIQPHFLFNTLNTVVSLIRSQPEKAREVLIFLGEFLRRNMRQGVSFHTVREECKHVEAYMAIEEARFSNKLKVDMNIETGTENIILPPLVLQPLVENAVRHGLLPKDSGGTVSIHVHKDGDSIQIIVRDDGIGISSFKLRDIFEGVEEEDAEIGIGLKNVHRRLLRLYGQGLLIESILGVGTIISFRVPISRSVLRGVTL